MVITSIPIRKVRQIVLVLTPTTMEMSSNVQIMMTVQALNIAISMRAEKRNLCMTVVW